MPEKIYMSPKEAAERYGVGRNLIYEILAMPEHPKTLKVGNRRCLPIAAFDEFMKRMFSESGGVEYSADNENGKQVSA